MELMILPLLRRGLLTRSWSRVGLRSGVRLGTGLSGPTSSVSMGVVPPMFSAAEVLPSGAVSAAFRTSPWPGEVLWDNTSVSSAACGGEARGGVLLSIISGANEFPEDDDCWGRSRAGLKHIMICYNL